MREKIEYALVKLFLGLAKIAPKWFIYRFFKILALLIYKVDRKRRLLTIENLSLAYPQKSQEEIETLAKRVYLELSQTVAEILLMFVDRFDIDDAIVNKEEVLAYLDRIKSSSKNGIIAMTAHFSNWELLAHFLAKHGLPMLAVGREGNNHLIETHITTPFRQKYGNDTVFKKNAMIPMVKRLKQGGNVGILIDQKAGKHNSVLSDFFGRPARTTLSVAVLKSKLNPLVIPIFIARVDQGKYRVIIDDAIEYHGDKQGDEMLAEMTKSYNIVMESVIRQYPEQWFWMHNRWRR